MPDLRKVIPSKADGTPADIAAQGDVQAVRDRLPAALRSSRLDAADVFTQMESLDDQEGADDVLLFTFTAPVQLAWVRSVGGVSRAHVGAADPDEDTGAYCADDEPHPITVHGTIVKVWAPVGATVSVWGYRYS